MGKSMSIVVLQSVIEPVGSKATTSLPAMEFIAHSSCSNFLNVWVLNQNRLNSVFHFHIHYHMSYPSLLLSEDETQPNNPAHCERIQTFLAVHGWLDLSFKVLSTDYNHVHVFEYYLHFC